MEIGILTFHSAMNFGAVLQCHGLYTTLCELGYDVSVVDYRPLYLYTPKQTLGIRNSILHPRSFLKALPFVREYNAHYERFMHFMKNNWKMTHPIYDSKELLSFVNKFDYIIVGSDQIWNPVHNGKDHVWFGSKDTKNKWITYAASAGNSDFEIDYQKVIERNLSNFKSISVRETKLKNVLNRISHSYSSIPVVLDPTLLASPSTWSKWYKPIIKGDYIVTYQARSNDNTFRIAEHISNRLGIKKIITLDSQKNVKALGYKPFPVSPSEFVSAIRNAKFLVTTSFHGTAFAIITGCPFFTLRLNDGKDERSENLLKLLGLENRMVDCNTEIDTVPIETNDIHDRLEELRTTSILFLKNAIK